MTYMVYGATGYTGRLVIRFAVEAEERPLLAGRNPQKVAAVAQEFDLDWVAFSLEDRQAAVAALTDVGAVLNAAGPYSATAEPMVAACLEAGTHYTDVTAENGVFATLQAMDAEARAAGVMVLPGMGAGGAPTDCLATHCKGRLPDADELNFYGGGLEVVSRGTAKTAMETIHLPTEVRREGELVALEQPLQKTIDVGGESRDCITVPLCEVMVAYWSTRIPNITTYVENTGVIKQMSGMPGWLKKFLGTSLGQRFIHYQLDKQPEGPTDEQRAAGCYKNMAQVSNAKGQQASCIAYGPEGYTLTAISVLEAARRATSGNAKPGYQTA